MAEKPIPEEGWDTMLVFAGLEVEQARAVIEAAETLGLRVTPCSGGFHVRIMTPNEAYMLGLDVGAQLMTEALLMETPVDGKPS